MPRAMTGLAQGPGIDARAVRLLVAGQATSTIGDACYAVALPWYVLGSAGGGSTVGSLGTVLACYGIARAAAIPMGGSLCDRLGPRRVLLLVDVVRTVMVALLAVEAASGRASLLALSLLSSVIGACQGAFLPGSYALMPSIAGPERLPRANAALTASLQVGSLAGPIIGAGLVAAGGPAAAFALDAGTFALSAMTLVRLPGLAAPTSPGARRRTPAREVLTAVPALPTMLVVVLAGNLASAGLFGVALPVLAHDNLGSGGYGAVLAGLAGGAVLGTIIGATLRPRRPAVTAGLFLIGQNLALAVVPFGGLVGATLAGVAFGASNGIGELVIVTALQRTFPAHLLGRLMGLVMLASAGAYPLSAALASAMVDGLGVRAAFVIGAFGSTLAGTYSLSQGVFRDFGATLIIETVAEEAAA
jgi:predicted MFS family arabinose efflux permease